MQADLSTAAAQPASLEEGEASRAPASGAAGTAAVFLDRESLVAELHTLLEAERAGAKVAAGLVAQARSPVLKALAETIRRDEVRWCGMLTRALQALGVTPTDAVGAFYEKAVAIPEVEARLAFVNRGQGWVVRRLKALLPKVRSDQLHGDLLRMLAAHDHNISQAETTLARLVRARGA
jgi:nitronate monooxygenase